MSSILTFLSNLPTYFANPYPLPSSPPLLSDRPCKYILDDSHSSKLTLPDGRTLGYATYGAPNGKPVFYNHGFPGSRLEAAANHEVCKELGLRMIAIDRPGFGWSSPAAKGTRVVDWPRDVEVLAEHLGVKEYAVMGASGGGPATLACAHSLPSSSLKAAAIICGMGPPDIGMRGADFAHRLGWPHGIRWAPTWMARVFWRTQAIGRTDLHEDTQLELMLSETANALPSERDIFSDTEFLRLSLRACREAFAQGYAPSWADGQRSCGEWGFRVQDIRKDLKVHLWYGTEDTFVPIVHGRTIKERLGEGCEAHFLEEGHAGIFIHWRREILESLSDSF